MKRKGQIGASSIEFALTLSFLIMLMYGIAGYAMPLLLSASYQQVASDALREGLAWQHRTSASDEDTKNHIREAITLTNNSVRPCNLDFLSFHEGGELWKVCLSPPSGSMLPTIKLPFVDFEFPPGFNNIQVEAALYVR